MQRARNGRARRCVGRLVIRGSTNTIPLHVEILYNEYNFAAAFAVASVLALLALITLAIKTYVEWQLRAEMHPEPIEKQG